MPAHPVKALCAAILARSGLPRILDRHLHPREVTILMYHGVTRSPLPFPDCCFLDERSFRDQMAYIHHHCLPLPLSRAVEALKNDTVRWPKVVLTFDDGFQNNFDVAFPLLREFNIPATIFLNTGLIDTEDTVWFCRLNHALATSSLKALTWRGDRYPLGSLQEKKQTSAQLQEILKELPAPALHNALAEICVALGVDPHEPLGTGSPFRMLSSEAIRTMHRSGLIEFGAHTQSHSILSHLSRDRQQQEIEGSLRDVERLTGTACRHFAYPNGRPQDYDGTTLDLLRSLKVLSAVTARMGSNNAATPPLELKRYAVGYDMPLSIFQLVIHHVVP